MKCILDINKIIKALLLFVLLNWISTTKSFAQGITNYAALPNEYAKAYNNLKTDTARIKNMIRYANNLNSASADSVLLFLKEAFAQSLRINYSEGCTFALMAIGEKYLNEGDYEKTIIIFKQAISFAQKASDKTLLPDLYLRLSLPYIYSEQLGLATYYNYKALAEATQNLSAKSNIIPRIYINMSCIWLAFEDTGMAMKLLKKAEESTIDSFQLHSIYANLGALYATENNFQKAYEYNLKAIHSPNIRAQITANANMGKYYDHVNNPIQAMIYYNAALSLSKKNYDYNMEIACCTALGYSYYQLKDYKNATKYYLNALDSNKTINTSRYIINAHWMLAKIYAANKEYKNSFEHQEKYIDLYEQVMDTANVKLLQQEGVKYKTAEKENQILLQKNDLKEKNIWIISIALSSLLLITFFILVYRISLHRQRLQKERINTLQQSQEIEQLQAMIKGEEKERARVGRELHDGIGGLLSAFAISFNSIGVGNEMLYNNEDYQRGVLLLDELTTVIRETSHNMVPEILYYHSLPEAIRTFCDYVQASKNNALEIDIQSYGSFNLLENDFNFSIYRIIQELIQNIVKHAYASHVIVQLIMKEATLNITVEDNGVGFEVNTLKNGLGLLNLQTRIKSLSGQFTIESQKGNGTTVFIELDIQNYKKTLYEY